MTKKLLLADDSITIQKVISIIFSTEDYQLITCDDGAEAFSKALAEYPDLVIADVNMPGKDGFELCEAIKSAPSLVHTSVLLLPGTFEHFDESRAEAVAADGWLSKPFESQALLDKVAQLIDAEPNRLAEAESAATGATEAVAEAEISESGLDESALGLDEVSELESRAEGESADDIWDAVSFEEEDLQQAEEAAEEVPLELTEEAAESDFSFADTDEPLELTQEVADEEMVEAEEPIELTEDDAVTFAEAPTMEEGFAAETAEEELPEAEQVSEDQLDEDEEILDLAEDDILEEEPAEIAAMVAEEEVTTELAVEEDVVPFDELPTEEDPIVGEQGLELEEESVAVSAELETETVVAEEPIVAPAADVSAGGSPVEQVEQQLRELPEDELKEVVARVAGPIVEKLANEMLEQIAWEVVPDLAESMIREEIRKIRQGAE